MKKKIEGIIRHQKLYLVVPYIASGQSTVQRHGTVRVG